MRVERERLDHARAASELRTRRGKALDAFELVTAIYAASGHELRKDWYGDNHTKGRHHRLVTTLHSAGSNTGIIADVSNTDFLHAVSLFHTRHHIFPQKWCKEHGIATSVYDSIINKTPLSYKTNRIIGGAAPSEYLSQLEKGPCQQVHSGTQG